MDWLSSIFLMIMGGGEINIFKRFKNKEFDNLEYLILKDNNISCISSDLNNLVKSISKISKEDSINKIVYNQKIPEGMNSGYFYGCLSIDETREIDKYIDKTKIFS